MNILLLVGKYDVLSESSWTGIVVTASVKEDEREGQGHTSASHLKTRCEHACFYMSAFLTSCLILSAMHGKIEQCVCIKLCVKIVKSETKPLDMLCEAFGEHSLGQTAVFEWHSHFKADRVTIEDDERSGQPSTSKMT
jgi:hypothetical protein